jgi:hypothetical protein
MQDPRIVRLARALDQEIMKATTSKHPVPIVRGGEFWGFVAATDEAKAEIFNMLKRRKQ